MRPLSTARGKAALVPHFERQGHERPGHWPKRFRGGGAGWLAVGAALRVVMVMSSTGTDA